MSPIDPYWFDVIFGWPEQIGDYPAIWIPILVMLSAWGGCRLCRS